MKWLIFLTLSVWIYWLLSAITARRRRVSNRLLEYVIELPKKEKSKIQKVPLWHRFLGAMTRDWVSRWPRKRLEKIQLRLLRAGVPYGLTVGEWIGIQFISVGVGVVVGILFVSAEGLKLVSLTMLMAMILLGWMGPDFWLSRRITFRQVTLRRQLPSTLDLLTVSVEAGLGFDQAMSKVADETTGPMSEEVQRVLREMQLGNPRVQALQRFAYRTGVDVIELFVSAVVQADKLGIGLVRVLRIQAAEVRRKQRADAQERAMKAPIKIIFPLVLFVFPALFIIVLGPAGLHIMQAFTKKG